jgi:hypothetical protein
MAYMKQAGSLLSIGRRREFCSTSVESGTSQSDSIINIINIMVMVVVKITKLPLSLDASFG